MKYFFVYPPVFEFVFKYFHNFYNTLLLKFSYTSDSFTWNLSCIFWITCDAKFIQTSNLKLRNFIQVFNLNHFFQWICCSTYYKTWKRKTCFVASKVCFAVKKVALNVEGTIFCKKDQICCFTISPFVWCVFYRNCTRKLVEDFSDCWSGTNRPSGFSD